MSNKIGKDFAYKPREAGKTFQRAGKQKAATEYEEAQQAFWKNYERLKAERLAREAAKSDNENSR
jgi:hypothetical protein